MSCAWVRGPQLWLHTAALLPSTLSCLHMYSMSISTSITIAVQLDQATDTPNTLICIDAIVGVSATSGDHKPKADTIAGHPHVP